MSLIISLARRFIQNENPLFTWKVNCLQNKITGRHRRGTYSPFLGIYSDTE